MMVEVQFSDVDNRHPEISQLVGRGTLFALSDNKGFIGQRNGHNRIRVYIVFRALENWAIESNINVNHPKEVRAHLLQLFSDWDQTLLNFIHSADENFICRPLYILPTNHQWETKKGVNTIRRCSSSHVSFCW
jgi:hypothetical protein